MINSLHTKNFQSHKDTKLEFAKGVNIITGTSDSGKTAILKALRWLIYNKPNGDSFVSHWCTTKDRTMVVATGDFGSCTRSIKGSENKYVLNNSIFKAFGRDVPEEIQNALNMSEVNIQQQFDSPFLLSDTSGVVAQHFNKIANLDRIDTSLQKIQKGVRQINNEIKYKEGQLKINRLELEQYNNLSQMEKDVQSLEWLDKDRIAVAQSIQQLRKITVKLDFIDDDIKEKSGILKLEKPVNRYINLVQECVSIVSKKVTLEELLNKLNSIELELDEKSVILNLESKVDFVIGKLTAITAIKAKISQLNTILVKLVSVGKKIKIWQEKLVKMESKFKNEFPDVCPLCGK